MSKLRIVVFTAGRMTPINDAFLRRLAGDPLLDLVAVIIDQHGRPRKPVLQQILNAIQKDGWGWVAFKIASKIHSLREQLALRIADWIHGPVREPAPLPVPIYQFADIHSAESVARIRSLSPDLGISMPGHSPGVEVTSIPTHGTLNIHHGRGASGYWEVLAGESTTELAIHLVGTAAGCRVVAKSSIDIEEWDT